MNISASILLTCLLAAIRGGTSLGERGEGVFHQIAHGDELRLEFPHPGNWRCRSEHGCVVCWNVAREPAYVLIRYANGVEPERREVAGGQSVEICPDEAQGAPV